MSDLLKEQELHLKTQDGEDVTYFISRFPAVQGREIIVNYPITAVPKVGNYKVNEEIMLKLMSFVETTKSDGTRVRLNSRTLVDNFVPDWETLGRIEVAMIEYNCSFFRGGLNSDFLESISQKAVTWITQTLIPLLGPSLQAAKRASENSKPN